jgi:hypothetical protein
VLFIDADRKCLSGQKENSEIKQYKILYKSAAHYLFEQVVNKSETVNFSANPYTVLKKTMEILKSIIINILSKFIGYCLFLEGY